MRGKANTSECSHPDIRPQNKARDRFKCSVCSKWFSLNTLPEHYKKWREAPTNQPKILIFDIETLPLLAYIWGVWNQNIPPAMMDDNVPSKAIVTWSAKWLNDSAMMSDAMTPEEALIQDDRRIVRSLWELFDEADILIAHNGIRFDIPVANTRFLLHGLTPPSPYKVIDTLLVARKQFDLPHNKMDYIAGVLGIEHKILTTFDLWRDCMMGKQDSLNYMQEYNDKDVFILEEIYIKLRPWIKNHPNYNLFSDKIGCCPTCGAEDTLEKNGKYQTTVNKYQSYRCSKCGSFSRTGKSNKKTELRSVAK
jgi:transposase-like protein